MAGLRAQLPAVAGRIWDVVVAEVAEYADPMRGDIGANITRAVELALGRFFGWSRSVRRSSPAVR